MKFKCTSLILFAAPLFLVSVAPCFAQFPQQQMPGPQQAQLEDPVRQLNLTPEQRERIRAIREETKEERAAINQRVREANIALEEALDSDNPDQALVEQRMRETATAQAASMRMRILTEIRIRRVLTPEQLNTLRTLRRQAREFRREQRLNPDERQRRPDVDGVRTLPNQRNGIGPLFPRRDGLQRRPRQ